MSRICIAVILILVLVPAAGISENWPTWRGPYALGTSGEANLPLEWSAGENIAWKLQMPDVSGSTPVIWEDSIFLSVADGDDLLLWSVDRRTGQKRWERHLAADNHKVRKGNMSSPSPVTDGDTVWVLTGAGLLKAFDFEGGELWTKDLAGDYGRFGLNHGYASSPLLHDGSIIVQVLHGMKTDDPSYVVSLEATTGKPEWRVERPTDAVMESPDSYTTPAVVEVAGETQIVVTGGDYVTGHDPSTGGELWRGGGLNPQNSPMYRVVASPVVNGDLIYVPTRVKPFTAFRSGGSGDITQSHRVFEIEAGPDVPTPTTDGDVLYVLTDRGSLTGYDARTGKLVVPEVRLARGTYSASPLLADGRIYATSEDGVTTVVKVGDEFEILGENDLDGYTLSSFAVSQGQLFLRSDEFLYCIGAS